MVLPQLHAVKEVAHLEQLPEHLTCQVPIALLTLLQDHPLDHLQHHAAREDAH